MGWPGPMTHRQFLVWESWLEIQLEFPEKTDYYLMQIGCEVVRSRIKDPKKVTPEDMRLKFKERGQPITAISEEERGRIEKIALSKWVASTGYKIEGDKLVKARKGETEEKPDTSQPLPRVPKRRALSSLVQPPPLPGNVKEGETQPLPLPRRGRSSRSNKLPRQR